MSYSNGLGLPEEILLRRSLENIAQDDGQEALDAYSAETKVIVVRKNKVIKELREALITQAKHAENSINLLQDMRQRRDAAVEVVNTLADELRTIHGVDLPREMLLSKFEEFLAKIKEREQTDTPKR